MKTGAGRRVAKRRHAANRLFLEITLVMIFMVLLSYAPITSQSVYTESADAPKSQQHGQAATGREIWVHLDGAGNLGIGASADSSAREWPAIQAYLQKNNIGVVVLDPESDVPFAVLSKVWQQAVQSGAVVRISTK